MILIDKEVKNPENKDFIEDIKKLSAQQKRCFILFNKKHVNLKIDINEVKMKMPEQELYSKVDVRINNRIKPEDIIEMLEHIPNHLAVRLEADYFDETIKLMKSKILIEKLKEQGTKLLIKGIEIEPKIIESKIDEDDLKNEVTEIKAKRFRMNMDCDK